MTEFQQDLIKILLDKLLLGAIAVLFSYWIAKLLEDYKNNKARELSVFRDKANAIFQLMGLITEHHHEVLRLLDFINLVKKKSPEMLSKEESKAGFDFITHNEKFMSKVGKFVALTDYDVMESLNSFMNETLKVTNIIKGDLSLGYHDEDILNEAVSGFLLVCRKSLNKF